VKLDGADGSAYESAEMKPTLKVAGRVMNAKWVKNLARRMGGARALRAGSAELEADGRVGRPESVRRSESTSRKCGCFPLPLQLLLVAILALRCLARPDILFPPFFLTHMYQSKSLVHFKHSRAHLKQSTSLS
jgi:hypothetical protein